MNITDYRCQPQPQGAQPPCQPPPCQPPPCQPWLPHPPWSPCQSVFPTAGAVAAIPGCAGEVSGIAVGAAAIATVAAPAANADARYLRPMGRLALLSLP